MASDLKEAFAVPDYRNGYAAGLVGSHLAQQLTVIRESRGLTVEGLAKAAGIPNATVIKYETDSNKEWDVELLLKIAEALDVRLKISFETFGSLIEQVDAPADSLWRPPFKEDPVFTGRPAFPPGPIGDMKRKLVNWYMEEEEKEKHLCEWLQGYDLPPVGDEVSPIEWLFVGTDGQPEVRQHLYDCAMNLRARVEEYALLTRAGREQDFRSNLAELLQRLESA